jgi:hypothetical protein
MTATVTFNNGVGLPALGFGVYQTPPEQTVTAVQTALEVGYRHIDTAAAYGNEREVGEAIRRSGVPRDEVFIETRVRISHLAAGSSSPAKNVEYGDDRPPPTPRLPAHRDALRGGPGQSFTDAFPHVVVAARGQGAAGE